MKRIVLFLSIASLLLIGCGSGDTRDTDAPAITVHIEQDGQRLQGQDGVIVLRRAPFSIVVTFRGPDSLFLHAWHADTIYRKAQNGEDLAHIVKREGAGITEEPFNPDRSLLLSPDEMNFLAWVDEENHRFNRVERDGDRLLCYRDVSRFIISGNSFEEKDVAEFSEKYLYLVFLKYTWNSDFSVARETGRHSIEIIFSGDDISNE